MARALRERGRRAWWKYSQNSTGNLYVPRTRILHVSLEDPPRNLESGAGLQLWRLKVRKSKKGISPFLKLELYYAGVKVQTLIEETAITSEELLAASWNASTLPSASGLEVEGRITTTSFAKGVEVDVAAFEWTPTLVPG